MDPIQKFFYKVICINFCDTNFARRGLFLFHTSVIVSTVSLVYYYRLLSMPMSLSLNHSRAVRVWFFSYIAVYVVIFVEGFIKDNKFNRQYKNVIRVLCEKHSHLGKDYYAWTVYGLLFLDFVYLALTHYSYSEYSSFHDGCLLPKFAGRIRLSSYLYLCQSVLRELKALIRKTENIPENASEEEFLRIQREYSDLWMTSQLIGDFYVWSVCSIFVHTFLDNVLYIFWLFTEDFNEIQYFWCKCKRELIELILIDFIYSQTILFGKERVSCWLWF